jgi:membrane-associated HD superfamily phosphohydrolase
VAGRRRLSDKKQPEAVRQKKIIFLLILLFIIFSNFITKINNMTKRGKTVRRGRGRGRTQRRTRTHRQRAGESTLKDQMLHDISKKETEKQIIADSLRLYHNPNQKMHMTHHAVNRNTEKAMQDHYNDLTEQIGKLKRQYENDNTPEDFSGGRRRRTQMRRR